jgi:hypothetical protein
MSAERLEVFDGFFFFYTAANLAGDRLGFLECGGPTPLWMLG